MPRTTELLSAPIRTAAIPPTRVAVRFSGRTLPEEA